MQLERAGGDVPRGAVRAQRQLDPVPGRRTVLAHHGARHAEEGREAVLVLASEVRDRRAARRANGGGAVGRDGDVCARRRAHRIEPARDAVLNLHGAHAEVGRWLVAHPASEHGDRHKQHYAGFPMIVAHLDLDAFFAAVEELENPELRSKPLIVGGDPHGRGVVATANYVARGFGIRSAMAAAEALRRCPQAVFVRPRHSLYRDYSREVWSAIREIVPTVEQAGIDEGYLDLGEVAPVFDDARALAEAVQTVVRTRTHLSCSLGVATSKVVAKVASDRRKPGGLTVVRPGPRGGVPRAVPDPAAPGHRPARRGAPRRARHRDDRPAGGARRRGARRRDARQGRARASRPRARHRPAAARGLDRAHLDLAGGDVRARHRRTSSVSTTSCGAWR